MSDTKTLRLDATGGTADAGTGSIFFIGNATVLLRWAGMTILTDPTFIHKHEQTWLGYGLHTTRLTDPAIEIADLPPLDLVLLSHFHGDHFDQVAEAELDKSLPILTTPASAKELNERGFSNTVSIDTWETFTIEKGEARLRITATPGKHGPALVDLVLPDVMGSLLEFMMPDGAVRFRLYITGDTLVIDDLQELPQRYPEVDLALLHLGGTQVLGIMVTMDGAQGVEMMRLVDPKHAIPIHFDDYDIFKSPLSDFQSEVEAAGLTDRVTYLSHGETYTFRLPGGGATSRVEFVEQSEGRAGALD
jgi:L-ascorbate metabolism protein UlaG (beta-lactamase superfamily)